MRRSPPRGPVGGDDPTLTDLRFDDAGSGALDDDANARLEAGYVSSSRNIDAPSRRQRFRDWRRHYLPLPDEVIDDYLAEDEYVIHYDHPSFRAFILQNAIQVLVMTLAGTLLINLLRGGLRWDVPTVAAFLILDGVLIYLAFRRLEARYTNYIITNLRLIRLSGIIGRRLTSIAWTRLTGIGYRQKAVARLLGFATITLESANEESGLREFSEINDPARFHELLLNMVSGKTGQKEGEPPPPPTKGERKSLRKRRRERAAQMKDEKAMAQAKAMAAAKPHRPRRPVPPGDGPDDTPPGGGAGDGGTPDGPSGGPPGGPPPGGRVPPGGLPGGGGAPPDTAGPAEAVSTQDRADRPGAPGGLSGPPIGARRRPTPGAGRRGTGPGQRRTGIGPPASRAGPLGSRGRGPHRALPGSEPDRPTPPQGTPMVPDPTGRGPRRGPGPSGRGRPGGPGAPSGRVEPGGADDPSGRSRPGGPGAPSGRVEPGGAGTRGRPGGPGGLGGSGARHEPGGPGGAGGRGGRGRREPDLPAGDDVLGAEGSWNGLADVPPDRPVGRSRVEDPLAPLDEDRPRGRGRRGPAAGPGGATGRTGPGGVERAGDDRRAEEPADDEGRPGAPVDPSGRAGRGGRPGDVGRSGAASAGDRRPGRPRDDRSSWAAGPPRGGRRERGAEAPSDARARRSWSIEELNESFGVGPPAGPRPSRSRRGRVGPDRTTGFSRPEDDPGGPPPPGRGRRRPGPPDQTEEIARPDTGEAGPAEVDSTGRAGRPEPSGRRGRGRRDAGRPADLRPSPPVEPAGDDDRSAPSARRDTIPGDRQAEGQPSRDTPGDQRRTGGPTAGRRTSSGDTIPSDRQAEGQPSRDTPGDQRRTGGPTGRRIERPRRDTPGRGTPRAPTQGAPDEAVRVRETPRRDTPGRGTPQVSATTEPQAPPRRSEAPEETEPGDRRWWSHLPLVGRRRRDEPPPSPTAPPPPRPGPAMTRGPVSGSGSPGIDDADEGVTARDALASLGRTPRVKRPPVRRRYRLPSFGQRARRPPTPPRQSRQLPAAPDDRVEGDEGVEGDATRRVDPPAAGADE